MDINDHVYESSPSPRESESPARTIDSVDSTIASMETIVDRSSREEVMQTTLENSTNTTNQCNKHSLTNSQISMISNDHKTDHHHSLTQADAQSHIYASPDFSGLPKKADDQPKLISHNEFEKTHTMESKARKKQRIPPKLITMKNPPTKLAKATPGGGATKQFPIQIVMGTIQLVLSISLVALGGLLIVRDAALAGTACGIWSGAIAAVTGALGVINLRKVKTAFLALSLVCVASSTLALALSGIGLIRDINKLEKRFDLMNASGEISAACGLVFALFLHFVVSIVSVYQCALRIYSKTHPDPSHILENVITANNSSVINQENVDEYIKTLSKSGKDKMMTPETTEQLMAMWMYTTAKKNALHHSVRSAPPQTSQRPIMLIPASNSNVMPTMLPPPTRHGRPMMLAPHGAPPPVPLPGMQYRGMTLPHMPPHGTLIYPGAGGGSYRLPSNGTYSRPVSEINRRRQKLRKGRSDANRRQRRKSDTDAENRIALTYTGLDRAIADNFLARQEQTVGGQIVDYVPDSESYRGGCRDVAM